MLRTGHVWQPMGSPRGLACSMRPPDNMIPPATALAPATNSLLETVRMLVSLWFAN